MLPVFYGRGIDDQIIWYRFFIWQKHPKFRSLMREGLSLMKLANYLIFFGLEQWWVFKVLWVEYKVKYFTYFLKSKLLYKDYGQYGIRWCNMCHMINTRDQNWWNKWCSDLTKWWNYVLCKCSECKFFVSSVKCFTIRDPRYSGRAKLSVQFVNTPTTLWAT